MDDLKLRHSTQAWIRQNPNPFNSVAAQKYTAALASGVVSDKEFYIKGKEIGRASCRERV